MEEREAWKASVSQHRVSPEYARFLKDAAAALSYLRIDGGERSQLLLANFGPIWGSAEVYKWFSGFSSVLELDWTAWERPPGIGSLPLDGLLSMCQAMFTWLHAADDHVVVRSLTLFLWLCSLSSTA